MNTMQLQTFILSILIICFIVPTVNAQIAGHGQDNQDCSVETLIGLLGVTSAGNVEVCHYYPNEVATATSGFGAMVLLTAPAATGAGTATMTTNWNAISGCTLNGASTNGGPGGTGFGTQFYSYQAFTMTGIECVYTVGPTYRNGAATVLYSAAFPATVVSLTAPKTLDNLNRLCNASALGTSCTTPTVNTPVSQVGTWQVDNLNRLCNASALGAACTTPTVNIAQSGTWTLDNTNRLCAASALGTSCTTPTVNTPLSGTVSVSQSGTWQIDERNRLCASSAFGASCTTPDINVHQDQACGATIQCLNQLLNGNMTTNNQFNVTSTQTPTTFEAITGTTGVEIFFLVGLCIIAIVVWSRSLDWLIQMLMMFITFIPGIIWLAIWSSKHWKGSLALAGLTFMLALYMGLRTVLDKIAEGREAKEKTP